MLNVLHVPAFQDNYIWMIRAGNRVAIVDPGDAEPVLAWLAREALQPTAILCTHNHHDHVDGVERLKQRYPNIPVFGPVQGTIPGVTHRLGHNDTLSLPDMDIALHVWATPGHTPDHISYHGQGALFCGDTLFSAGCGRLFSGMAQQMHDSLVILSSLPDNTLVYCAHEYTESNLGFALTVEPQNRDARTHLADVRQRRAQGLPSLPSTLGLERRINPFLRTGSADVAAAAQNRAGNRLTAPEQVFSTLRRWKDELRG